MHKWSSNGWTLLRITFIQSTRLGVFILVNFWLLPLCLSRIHLFTLEEMTQHNLYTNSWHQRYNCDPRTIVVRAINVRFRCNVDSYWESSILPRRLGAMCVGSYIVELVKLIEQYIWRVAERVLRIFFILVWIVEQILTIFELHYLQFYWTRYVTINQLPNWIIQPYKYKPGLRGRYNKTVRLNLFALS